MKEIIEQVLNEKKYLKDQTFCLEKGINALNNLLQISKEDAGQVLSAFNEFEKTKKNTGSDEKGVESDKKEEKEDEQIYEQFITFCNSRNEYKKDCEKYQNILTIMYKFVAYCDLKAANKATLNEYDDNRVMANAGIRQNAWIPNLLNFLTLNECNNTELNKIEQNIDTINISSFGVRRAIKYFCSPEKYLPIISEYHLNLISQYYLGYNAADEDLIGYFNSVFECQTQEITNQANRNCLYTSILYKDEEKTNWQSRTKAIVKRVKDLLDNHHNVILTGAPGTGKTYLAQKDLLNLKDLTSNGDFSNNRVQFVQFHPTYDYTDFVEGLRPIQKGNNIVFERKDGIFKRFCKCAILGLPIDASDDEINKETEGKYKDKKYLFIIDEINRGDISKIFGELFFAIDPGYRGGKDCKVQTQYQNLAPKGDIFNKGFYIPDNVYIIGTMNDIDRSVESLDFAFRRRFAFKEISVKDTQEAILGSIDEKLRKKLISKMNNLNEKLGVLGLSEAYYIGAAYFKKIEKYSAYNPDIQFKKLWEDHLKGVLYEYFRGEVDADKKLTELKGIYDKD